MTCGAARRRISARRDDPWSSEYADVDAHVASCSACRDYEQGLGDAMALLGELPRLVAPFEIAATAFDRLEVDNRKPGLRALLVPSAALRPFFLPSLVHAAMLVALILLGALALDARTAVPWRAQAVASARPIGSAESARVVADEVGADLVAALEQRVGTTDLLVETIVSDDGCVASLRVIDGNMRDALPLLEAMARRRYGPFERGNGTGAVSFLRLVSYSEVRALS